MQEPIDLEKLKLAALSEAFSDEEVEQVFLELEVEKEEDIREAVFILRNYRPKFFKKMNKKLGGRRR